MEKSMPRVIEALITAKQARQQLSIGNTHLYALAKAGRLTIVKIGKSTRFRASEVNDLATNGTGGRDA